MAGHPGAQRGDVVHHLYPNSAGADLVPFCGTTPGPDEHGVWHTGHEIGELIELSRRQEPVCPECLTSDALERWHENRAEGETED